MVNLSQQFAPYFSQPLAWQKKNGFIVITGGLGFIGSCLANFFMAAGQNILLVDDASDEKLNNVKCLPPAAPSMLKPKPRYLLSRVFPKHLPLPPIITPDELLGLTRSHYHKKNIIAIVHLGAVSDTRSSDEDIVLTKNTDFSAAMWQKSIDWGIPLIYASTAATYGDGSAGFAEPTTLADLEKLKPLNLYGRSKHLFDLQVMAAKQDQAVNQSKTPLTPPFFAGLKFFNVFGPNEYHKGAQSSVIPRFYNQAYDTQKIKLFSSTDRAIKNGEQTRDFVWVMDCICVMVKLLQFYYSHKSSKQDDKDFLYQSSGIFNVGSGQATSFNQLVSFMLPHLPRAASGTTIDYIPTPADLVQHYQNHTRAVIDGLRQLIGFKPTPVATAVGFYINDFLKPTPMKR
ncbi:MAG: NAD-dependent epimerase/dehydratase family protein [Hydrotalea sp.]|nr:NAD-dependent epimerase/dehydratase family protein [Hydrotalea sp.]